MKKEFHGFRLERVNLPSENIITASANGCTAIYNYLRAPLNSWAYEDCHVNEFEKTPERFVPYYSGNAS